MTTKFFIPTDHIKPKEVSETEHAAWANSNASKYNHSWQSKDGRKSFSLTFKGTQKPGGDLILFILHSKFSDNDGNLITEIHDEFDDYEHAKEHYEFNLLLSGA